MTSSPPPPPPDLSSLSLNGPPQRLHDYNDYEGNIITNQRSQFHFSTSPPIPAQSQYNPLTTGQSPVKKPLRSALPTQWLENTSDNRSISPHNNSDFSSSDDSPPTSHLQVPTLAGPTVVNPEDDVIPTAIVIKNIPFNVKRETLLDIIASLNIPTPYAFNYHLDQQGSFRGLAFANFRQAADADAVVVALNGFDVQGRKLRVEYKKVLQAGEKERIEREKAIRRMRSMQLDKDGIAGTPPQQQQLPQMVYEDYSPPPVSAPSFMPSRSFSTGQNFQQPQYSPPGVSSMPPSQHFGGLTSPTTVMNQTPSISGGSDRASNELDLNDPSTLEIYSRILLFKDDRMRDELAFSRTLSPKQRRVVHLIAQKLGVYHYSIGEGEERYAVVTRIDPNRQQQIPRHTSHTLSRAPSAYLTPSGTTMGGMSSSLRAKKSMPDMKTLHSTAPRLSSRSSNGNIREGYATISSPRRGAGGFGSLFGNSSSAFGGGGGIPPVPSLPSSVVGGLNGSGVVGANVVLGGSTGGSGGESPGGVVRQPRGPASVGGFGTRRVTGGEAQSRMLESRTHEPLEI